jgi:hypothetical protein
MRELEIMYVCSMSGCTFPSEQRQCGETGILFHNAVSLVVEIRWSEAVISGAAFGASEDHVTLFGLEVRACMHAWE